MNKKNLYWSLAAIIILAVYLYNHLNDKPSDDHKYDPTVEVMSMLEKHFMENKQNYYKCFHSVAATCGGFAKNVKITEFKLDQRNNIFACECTIYWETAITPHGFTTIKLRGSKNNNGNWKIDNNSIVIVDTNGLLDTDFYYNLFFVMGSLLTL